MSFDGDISRLSPRSRNTRSHSLKPQSQPIVFKQRSKRTMSLPSKPVLLPLINVQRCYDNWDEDSEDDENVGNEEEMGTFRLICCIFPLACAIYICCFKKKKEKQIKRKHTHAHTNACPLAC